MNKQMVYSSTYGALEFPNCPKAEKIYSQYIKQERDIFYKTYGRIRSAFGIYASNQDKFVRSIKNFNEMDCTKTEEAYLNYIKEDKYPAACTVCPACGERALVTVGRCKNCLHCGHATCD